MMTLNDANTLIRLADQAYKEGLIDAEVYRQITDAHRKVFDADSDAQWRQVLEEVLSP